MIVIVREVREKSSLGANAPRRRQRFIQTHVRGMRISAERVQDNHFHVTHGANDFIRHFLAIAEIREPLASVLLEEESERDDPPVWQREWRELQIADFEW